MNDAHLEDGYTIETLLRIDESWAASDNAWMKALVRSGNRSKIGVPQSRWDWTASPTALGLSNLREFQWTEIPVETSKGDRTSWSGEIILDRWVHVALVNDPANRSTTMYVDGAPVLRNATDTLGHGLQDGMPWLFGSDWVDDRATNGWLGCIGETRVVDRPLPASQWLTARVDLTGLTVEGPAPVVSRPVATLEGTGRPGSVVTVEGDLTVTTTVATDGTWSVPAPRRQRPGTYAVDVRQWLGTRASEPVEVTWRYGTRG
ncbi:LamG-like jellyroll fold domain-containing protein [Jannaschia sp. R86511]|uniref:LamG-like jellyroll fold domain-containing protein n=1 Tax=Jannaschia sp. R86511 TaxID=3093853 RepID=UPI0036D33932